MDPSHLEPGHWLRPDPYRRALRLARPQLPWPPNIKTALTPIACQPITLWNNSVAAAEAAPPRRMAEGTELSAR